MKTLFLILLFTATSLSAQVAELTLLDASTKQPIPNVEAYYTRSLNGTITNEEGKLAMQLKRFLQIKPLPKQQFISILRKYNLTK